MSALARAVVHRILGTVRSGRLLVRETWSGRTIIHGPPQAELRGELHVHDPRFYGRVLRGRSIALGEAYAAGQWDSPDLVAVFRIAAREIARADPARGLLERLTRPMRGLRPGPPSNTRAGSRRNIAAHYDLGDELFELFLDREAMLYSSALYTHPDDTLEAAQRAKLDRICEALELREGVHLLEIGTGWGGLAVWAASRYGSRVTTTTISSRQRAYAEERIARAGLADRVRVLGEDYRDLEGRYDRLVAVEMIEAVGADHFDLFFRRCSELLQPDGLMFLQAICIDDRAYLAERDSPSFANRLIFPGGCLPSHGVIAGSVAQATNLRPLWLEDISASYVLTLRAWRERFIAAEQELERLGYDRSFRRLWELYLAFSEAGFSESRISDLQMLLAKPRRSAGLRSEGARAPGATTGDGDEAPPRVAPAEPRTPGLGIA